MRRLKTGRIENPYAFIFEIMGSFKVLTFGKPPIRQALRLSAIQQFLGHKNIQYSDRFIEWGPIRLKIPGMIDGIPRKEEGSQSLFQPYVVPFPSNTARIPSVKAK